MVRAAHQIRAQPMSLPTAGPSAPISRRGTLPEVAWEQLLTADLYPRLYADRCYLSRGPPRRAAVEQAQGQRGILVTAAASALGNSYCSLAWGGKLGKASDAAVAAGVLNGSDAGLTDQEKAIATWARKVARNPNATTPADIQALRDSGLDDSQIFAITAFVALRLAFSTINDSLGAQPDAQLAQSLPPEVREAVTYGRPVAQRPAV